MALSTCPSVPSLQWNTGPDAYRRSELGPKATIVRRFSSTGTSSSEVLDCTGRVVSCRPSKLFTLHFTQH